MVRHPLPELFLSVPGLWTLKRFSISALRPLGLSFFSLSTPRTVGSSASGLFRLWAPRFLSPCLCFSGASVTQASCPIQAKANFWKPLPRLAQYSFYIDSQGLTPSEPLYIDSQGLTPGFRSMTKSLVSPSSSLYRLSLTRPSVTQMGKLLPVLEDL